MLEIRTELLKQRNRRDLVRAVVLELAGIRERFGAAEENRLAKLKSRGFVVGEA